MVLGIGDTYEEQPLMPQFFFFFSILCTQPKKEGNDIALMWPSILFFNISLELDLDHFVTMAMGGEKCGYDHRRAKASYFRRQCRN